MAINEHPILAQVVLGYSPMIDRERAVSATRLTVFPVRPDAALDAAALLAAVAEVWPEAGGKVALNVVSETLLQDLLRAQPSANLMLEVPAFMACNPELSAYIQALYGRGNTLLLKGRPRLELPRDVLPCFKHSIIDLADERRSDSLAPPGVMRQITHMQAGVRTLAELDASFKRGAVAVLGWPIDDMVQPHGGQAQPDLATILELMRRINKEESIDRLEDTLKLDPTLAFKLLRYINSPAFGLRVEVGSFRHALMLLGYTRLKRWLALLLASASKDRDMKPVMFAALRRGLLMEELTRASAGGNDEQMRNEAFICGVFSLLDRMMKQSFSDLLKAVPVPDSVRQALVDGAGPYQPFLEVVRAVENESLFDVRDSAERLLLGVGEINRAVLRALAQAMQIQ
ncbi:MAG: HDOD domain-containing protein [Burkholderiaceae bacterium]|nr:HDOD domain-containing protein [Burkholderiaceae bacterium]